MVDYSVIIWYKIAYFQRPKQWRIQDLTLKVEVKVILACFGHIAIKIKLKNNRERSERNKKWEK